MLIPSTEHTCQLQRLIGFYACPIIIGQKQRTLFCCCEMTERFLRTCSALSDSRNGLTADKDHRFIKSAHLLFLGVF